MSSFTEKLSQEALDYFNKVSHSPFSQQAVAFLNAYWAEVHEEAEFIFGYTFFILFKHFYRLFTFKTYVFLTLYV